MMKISLVTPSYNQAAFLPFTIDSVLCQRYPGLEYIIIDGGSSDASVDVIRQNEQHLAYWVSEPDRGQSDAINKGWKRARGDILGYLNSDDLLLPGSLERVAAFFESHADVDFIYGNAIIIDETGRTTGRLDGQPFDLRRLLLREITIPQPAMFFRRCVLDDTGYLDEEFHYTMDFDFWLKTAIHHAIEYVPFDLAAMRLHDGAKTVSRKDLFYRDELEILAGFLSRPGLPGTIKGAEKRAFARCYMRGAEALMAKGRFRESGDLIIKGVYHSPEVLLNVRIALLCCSQIIHYDLHPAWVRLLRRFGKKT